MCTRFQEVEPKTFLLLPVYHYWHKTDLRFTSHKWNENRPSLVFLGGMAFKALIPSPNCPLQFFFLIHWCVLHHLTHPCSQHFAVTDCEATAFTAFTSTSSRLKAFDAYSNQTFNFHIFITRGRFYYSLWATFKCLFIHSNLLRFTNPDLIEIFLLNVLIFSLFQCIRPQ